MALINGIIPTSNFELIRDRIGQILVTEFTSQAALANDNSLNPAVYSERFIPIDKTETPLINVCFASGTYDNKNIKSVDGNYIYNLDFYTSSKSTEETGGDTLATRKLHKLMGMARAIIENPRYKTLGYDAPFNCNVAVTSIQISDPEDKDSTHKVQGRLLVSVRVPETIELLTATKIGNNTTRVMLDDTAKGYRYVWSTTASLPIGDYTNSFTLPQEYSGLVLDSIGDDNQIYSKGFTQSGDNITMTNGVVFTKGQIITLNLRLNDYTAKITIPTAGKSFTLPAAYAGKTIKLILDDTQAYTEELFTQTGLTVTMSDESTVTFSAGQEIMIWYGVQLVPITAEAGNTFTLPDEYQNFEIVTVFDSSQAYSAGFTQTGLTGQMTNTVTFKDGQQLIILTR